MRWWYCDRALACRIGSGHTARAQFLCACSQLGVALGQPNQGRSACYDEHENAFLGPIVRSIVRIACTADTDAFCIASTTGRSQKGIDAFSGWQSVCGPRKSFVRCGADHTEGLKPTPANRLPFFKLCFVARRLLSKGRISSKWLRT